MSFSALFAGVLAAVSSNCSQSFIKVTQDFEMPFTLYMINVALASSNKSCCTNQIKSSNNKWLNVYSIKNFNLLHYLFRLISKYGKVFVWFRKFKTNQFRSKLSFLYSKKIRFLLIINNLK